MKLIPSFFAALLLPIVYSNKLKTTPPPFNEHLAMKGAYYNAAAYCSYKTLESWDCGRPCKFLPHFKNVTKIL